MSKTSVKSFGRGFFYCSMNNFEDKLLYYLLMVDVS